MRLKVQSSYIVSGFVIRTRYTLILKATLGSLQVEMAVRGSSLDVFLNIIPVTFRFFFNYKYDDVELQELLGEKKKKS